MTINNPNKFRFRIEGDQVRLVTPSWDDDGYPSHIDHCIDHTTAERLLAELTACLRVPYAAAMKDGK